MCVCVSVCVYMCVSLCVCVLCMCTGVCFVHMSVCVCSIPCMHMLTSVRSLENVTSLVLPMSPPPDPALGLHTTPPDNSHSTSTLTPTWVAGKQKRDESTTPTRRLRTVAQGEKCGDIGAEQVLEEKEVKEERWHCDDNRSRSPSPGRSRRTPLLVSFVCVCVYMCCRLNTCMNGEIVSVLTLHCRQEHSYVRVITNVCFF